MTVLGTPEGIEAALADVFALLLPHADERQRRLMWGAAARVLGHGGIRVVAGAARVAESTVSRGVREPETGWRARMWLATWADGI